MFTIYTKPDCNYCVKAKDLLNMKGEPFLEIDISENVDAREKIKRVKVLKLFLRYFIQMVNTLVTTTLWREDMYEYKCKIRKVVDGDTVDVDIDLGFGVWLRKQRVRLVGIDTPESRTKDLQEKKYGLDAKRVSHKMGDLWWSDH